MVKRIDTDAISSRPEDRLRFLEELTGFTEGDWAAIKASAGLLAPRLVALAEAVYDHLLAFDDTRRPICHEGMVTVW
jgi:hypothetical protein